MKFFRHLWAELTSCHAPSDIAILTFLACAWGVLDALRLFFTHQGG